MRMCIVQCRNPKRAQKGPHFKEDDCTLSVYLSLIVFGNNGLGLVVLIVRTMYLGFQTAK